jgi:DNA recombination protein RmuC
MGGVLPGVDWVTLGLGAGLGLVVGALGAWLVVALRARDRLAVAREEAVRLVAALEGERRLAAERLAIHEAGEARLRDAFEALSRQALDRNSSSFLDLARTQLGEFQQGARGDLDARQAAIDELLRPVRESLERMDAGLRRVETSHGTLTERVAGLHDAERRLRDQTASLAVALKTPGVRGRWGEVQLRRVVELAGMAPYCDFDEQATGDDGRLRPDLVIRLPGGRNIVVDAKAVMGAYLEAEEAIDDQQRRARLQDHARLVREHLMRLAAKPYRDQFQPTPEFVVMFLPGENFFRAAMEVDPALFDDAIRQRIVLASPLSLIALLWGAAQAWKEQRMTETADEVCAAGQELYKRVSTLADHFDKLGGSLQRAVEAYNQAVGSLDRRVLPSARRMKELGAVSGDDLEPRDPIDVAVQAPQAPELLPLFDPARGDPGDADAPAPRRAGGGSSR